MMKVLSLKEHSCKQIVIQSFLLLTFWFFSLSMNASSLSTATDSLVEPNSKIAIEGTLLVTDKLQQCYVVKPNNDLIKYSKDGQLLFQYNNNRLGTLKWVDATDPFNILLFYPDYFTVVLLDRTLNMTGEYQLYDLNITDVNVVAMANDNNLWFYDENSGKLRKISRAGEVLEESVNTRLLLEKSIRPVNMREANNRVYLNVPDTGILIFDNFGTYLRQIPLLDLVSFQIVDDQLIYQKSDKLFSYHLKSFLTSEISLPFKLETNNQLKIQKGVLFLLKAKELLIYKMN